MSFEEMVPVKVIRKPQEVNPQAVQQQGGQKDMERVMAVRVGLELGLDQSQLQDPAVLRKVEVIRMAAQQEAGANGAEALLWQLRSMGGKLGTSGIGQSKLDQMFQYATLLLDKSLIQSNLVSEEI